MKARLRRCLSAFGVVGVVVLGLGVCATSWLALSEARAGVAELAARLEALKAREARTAGRRGPAAATPFFEAKTVTLAGAALQQRLEAAVDGAKGRLASSRIEVAPRGDDRRVAVSAELTIAQPGLQALLYDIETGRPYLFVDAFEARAREAEAAGGAMRVSLTVSGQWGETK